MNTMLKSVALAGVIVFGGVIAGDYIYDKVSNETSPSMVVALEPAAGPNADQVAEEQVATMEKTAKEAAVEEAPEETVTIEGQNTLDEMIEETAALTDDVSADTQSVADEADALIKQVIEIEPAAGDFVKAIDENTPEVEEVQEETPALDDKAVEQ